MTPTLLLADDSVTIQRVIELTFANEDVRVVSTSDGEAALRHIDTERPDIVLADVGMPKRDGYDVASHIKNTPALHDIPVLLLTGAFEPLDESRARASGCDGILVKPFEPQQLVGRVKELLAGQHTPALWPAGVPKVEETPPPPVRPALRIAPKPEPAFPPATSALWPVAVPAAAPRPVSVPAHVAASTAAPHPSRLPDVGETFQHEFEQLDAVFAGLDPEATPGLNEESARDFARDLDVRPIAEPAAATRPFGDWDLPSPPPQADPVPSGPLGGAVSGTWDLNASEVAEPVDKPREMSKPVSLEALPGPVSRPAPTPASSDASVEEAVRRVLARMTAVEVRRIVLETAERLIKDELEKIKGT